MGYQHVAIRQKLMNIRVKKVFDEVMNVDRELGLEVCGLFLSINLTPIGLLSTDEVGILVNLILKASI